MEVKVTALVHTYNSERYLQEVFEALRGFDELLVCDMHSTDRTLEICKQYGARVVFHELVFVDTARNFAISQAENEWVMIVDSDEVVPSALRDYVYTFAAADSASALQIPVLEFFMGHSLRSSYPNLVTRLVRKSKVFWPETVHSKPTIDGVVAKINPSRRDLALRHYSNPSISWRMDKINYYSSFEVERKAHKWKYRSLIFTFLSATVRFIKGYIIKGGFLDGKAGFAYSSLEFFYKFVVLFKIWETETKLIKTDKSTRTIVAVAPIDAQRLCKSLFRSRLKRVFNFKE